jgi:mono/diheme cytochrome c family protein
MRKILKIVVVLIFVVFAVISLGLTYIFAFLPNIPVEEIKIEYTPERIERGRYLANHVSQCVNCHSTRDWTKFSGQIVPGTIGKGGEVFDQSLGYPGRYYAQNITPYHLKDWSDGELFRAITSGVSKDGRALFPVMPYPNFGKMDREDIYSIITYIRTLPSIENTPPASKSNFPMSWIIRFIPSKPEFTAKPSPNDKVNYGKYLVTAGSCVECHTVAKRGQIVKEMEFAGGRFLKLPNGILHSSNITPDKGTGIGNWTKESFIARFRAIKQNPDKTVAPDEFNTNMPWSDYAEMTDEDLEAIFSYLQTVKPVANKIEKVFEPK